MNMELKVLSQEKSVLPRKEISAVVEFEKITPARKNIKKELAKQIKGKEDLLIIKKVYGEYGERKAKITAYLYDTNEALESIEYAKVIEKNKTSEEKPKEEAKGETPAKEEVKTEEKPAEEKKPEAKPAEEPKSEEKKPAEKKEEEKGE